MKQKLLSRKNAIYTSRSSNTTVMINYDDKKEILEIEFTGGHIYHYLKVEPQVWEEYRMLIKNGGSSGKFINTRIKPFYKYKEIENQ